VEPETEVNHWCVSNPKEMIVTDAVELVVKVCNLIRNITSYRVAAGLLY